MLVYLGPYFKFVLKSENDLKMLFSIIDFIYINCEKKRGFISVKLIKIKKKNGILRLILVLRMGYNTKRAFNVTSNKRTF